MKAMEQLCVFLGFFFFFVSCFFAMFKSKKDRQYNGLNKTDRRTNSELIKALPRIIAIVQLDLRYVQMFSLNQTIYNSTFFLI